MDSYQKWRYTKFLLRLLRLRILKPTFYQWLKLQQCKRKQEPVHATASTASTETDTPDARVDTNEGDDAHKQRKIVRRYDDSYLSFGFTWCGDINEPKPQCVICSEKL